MQWYFAANGQRQGPLIQAEFDQRVRDGVIKSDTLVWREGMPNWVPYATLAASGPVSAAPALSAAPAAGDDTEVCVVSGKRRLKREMIQYEGRWVSAEHRDEFFQRLREGVALPGASVIPGPFGYGGFWRRFCARFVDGLVLSVAGMMVGAVIGGIFGAAGMLQPDNKNSLLLLQGVIQLVSIAIGVSYEAFFVRKFDATPGKMALGLKVLRSDGAKLSIGRIIGRYFATILNYLTLLIGFIMAGFDEEKRGLHDRICDTRVIKTK